MNNSQTTTSRSLTHLIIFGIVAILVAVSSISVGVFLILRDVARAETPEVVVVTEFDFWVPPWGGGNAVITGTPIDTSAATGLTFHLEIPAYVTNSEGTFPVREIAPYAFTNFNVVGR